MKGISIDSKLDDSFFDSLEERQYRLGQVEIEYGYYAEKDHKGSGMSIGSLALIQEYGSIKRNIPARPFVFYSATLLNDQDIELMKRGMVDYLFRRKSATASFSRVGKMGVRTIQRSIMTQRFTPLKPQTIAEKGSSTILVEKNELINNAKWKINEKS